jgi:hypothetical protein
VPSSTEKRPSALPDREARFELRIWAGPDSAEIQPAPPPRALTPAGVSRPTSHFSPTAGRRPPPPDAGHRRPTPPVSALICDRISVLLDVERREQGLRQERSDGSDQSDRSRTSPAMASTWSDTGQPRHGLDGSDRSRAFASPAMASPWPRRRPALPWTSTASLAPPRPHPATTSPELVSPEQISPEFISQGPNCVFQGPDCIFRDPIALYFAYKDLIAFCFVYKDPIAFYFCIQGSLYKY